MQQPNSKPTPPKPCNLVLVGFMACGKTTLGKQLAEKLSFGFIDIDHQIEEIAGCSIPDIFASEGEKGFRQRESSVLKCCRQVRKQVIATGGGAVIRPQNRHYIKQIGYTIWLRATPEATFERASRNSNRPLLQTENPAARISELMLEREPWYREVADCTINTDNLHPQESICGIIDYANIYYSTQPAAYCPISNQA